MFSSSDLLDLGEKTWYSPHPPPPPKNHHGVWIYNISETLIIFSGPIDLRGGKYQLKTTTTTKSLIIGAGLVFLQHGLKQVLKIPIAGFNYTFGLKQAVGEADLRI